MAFEISNRFEAGGKFDGRDPAAHPDNPIFVSKGIQEFDPSTTPLDPVGGFTRLGAGSYLIQMLQGIDWHEALVFVSCYPGTPMLLLADMAPSSPDQDELDGKVTVLGTGEAVDAIFALAVHRITTGLDGTEPII